MKLLMVSGNFHYHYILLSHLELQTERYVPEFAYYVKPMLNEMFCYSNYLRHAIVEICLWNKSDKKFQHDS